jgi:hypothetical protein
MGIMARTDAIFSPRSQLSAFRMVSGPSGSTAIEGRQWEIAGWDLWESELDPRQTYRGWFEQRDLGFVANRGDELRLVLLQAAGPE